MLYCTSRLRAIMTTISANLQVVKARIAAAASAVDRNAADVRLLAVSKGWPASCVRSAAACGQRAFGENYLQEASLKVAETADLELEWHFIGPLQSNKTREIAETFAWVHSVDREKVAARLSAQRPQQAPPLQVLIQVNVSGEASKSGVAPDQLTALAGAVAALPRLKLRGLMAIPEPTQDMRLIRARFVLLRELMTSLNRHGMDLDGHVGRF
jgi:pyridoxal phosphate enzyme (YggS family)